ncbi:MAG: bifunctional phosphopantothenoylcysteine decarboxylase/phosphopantothenate--cysteine ligase CoaBC [Bacillota bacterium]|nr:bifunctional phosphopantothenoylcysteine decarboxylase/phosphopantothenate--cysteine ligase CoaBC [Bacillota bacterium]
MDLKDKKIVLGISGGISAYKSPGICSLLRKQGAKVKVVMTQAATEFVSPLTFRTMTDNLVYSEMFEKNPSQALVEHIELTKWADIIVIAPATANTIAKIANGIADNLLTSMMLAYRSPVIIVPAMNTYMLNNPATRQNLKTLRDRGMLVLGTHTDLLACKDVGDGKMLEPEEIVDEIDTVLRKKDLAGKNFLITAGPTIEAIDPVRYLSNHSSGKMGYELAREAMKRGAKVKLISGPTNLQAPKGLDLIQVQSTEDMYQAVEKYFDQTHVLIKAAAPADFRPAKQAMEKIKKKDQDQMVLELSPNKDILKTMGQRKKDQVLVGFAAESENELENGLEKITKKNLDLIVINNIKAKDAGFKTDTNKVLIVDKDKQVQDLDLMTKTDLANVILDRVLQILK